MDTMQTFERFVNQKVVLLTTYRRDSTPVETRVNVVVKDGRAYFRTFDKSGKAKRLAHTAEVDIAPSTSSGKPTGPAMPCRTRPLDDGIEPVRRLLNEKHPVRQGLLVPMIHKLRGFRTLYYELIPNAG